MAAAEIAGFAAANGLADRKLRLEGALPGGTDRSLIISGDGSKRSDRIAIVAGSSGPVAEAELQSDKPVLSSEDLDVYAELLGGEITALPAPA